MTDPVQFLQLMHPGRLWVLTAIEPKRGADHKNKIETVTFSSEDGAASEWVAARDGRFNLYFQVNPPTRPLTKKASRGDVARLAYLHVDLDPRAGENHEAELERLRELAETPPDSVPAPTVALFSGGGYQLFWRLEEPFEVGGDLGRAEEAARWNKALELAYGADHCHDISRIMRLPGTINVPDHKKRARGRIEARAELVWHEPARVFSLEQFPKAEPRAASTATPLGGRGGGVAISPANRIAELAELNQWGVPDRVKVIIDQGHHPEEPKGDGNDGSRSSWLFDAVCQLVRQGVPDEVVYAIITDPGWRISESVLELKGRAERYALRQIHRAHEHVDDPVLARMNTDHAVLLQEGGKCRVMCWRQSEIVPGRRIPVLQSFADFRNRYMNELVQAGEDINGKPKFKKAGDWWLAHPKRRQFLELRFDPDQPEEFDGYLNLWQGLAIVPASGNWSLMREHLLAVLAAGDEEHADYLLKWSAWLLQNPGLPAEVAAVLRGGRGVGKGVYFRALRDIFGDHALHISNSAHLTGNFNSHLRDACFVFADEAIAPGDRKAEAILKTLITEDQLPIEGKGKDVVNARNRVTLAMASNERWVVPAGMDERRFAIFRVSDHRAGDHDYFGTLVDELNGGGLEAMAHDLLTMDLEGWHPRANVPATEELGEQKANSLRGFERVWLDILRTGEVPTDVWRSGDGTIQVGTKSLRDHAAELCRREEITFNEVGSLLNEMDCEKVDSRPRGYRLPPLEEARRWWEENRFKVRWPDVEGWELLSVKVEDHTYF